MLKATLLDIALNALDEVVFRSNYALAVGCGVYGEEWDFG
jgi:hypothetical protein